MCCTSPGGVYYLSIDLNYLSIHFIRGLVVISETGSPTVTVGAPKPAADSSTSTSHASPTHSRAVEELLSSAATVTSEPAVASATSSAGSADDNVGLASPSSTSTPSSATKTKKRNRCYSCKKKVGLTGE